MHFFAEKGWVLEVLPAWQATPLLQGTCHPARCLGLCTPSHDELVGAPFKEPQTAARLRLSHALPKGFLFFFYVYLFLRERASEGGAEREGDRGSQAGSTLSAQGPTRGSNS